MANIRKLYEDAAKTTQMMPQTHERAVIDDNGTTAETKFWLLFEAYEGLTQSDIVVVADHTAVASPVANTIYREQGVSSYTDWMYYDSAWKEMATYNNAIDDTPTAGSSNLVKSSGVEKSLSLLKNYTTSESFIAGEYTSSGSTFGVELSTVGYSKGAKVYFKLGGNYTSFWVAGGATNTTSWSGTYTWIDEEAFIGVATINGNSLWIRFGSIPSGGTIAILNSKYAKSLEDFTRESLQNLSDRVSISEFVVPTYKFDDDYGYIPFNTEGLVLNNQAFNWQQGNLVSGGNFCQTQSSTTHLYSRAFPVGTSKVIRIKHKARQDGKKWYIRINQYSDTGVTSTPVIGNGTYVEVADATYNLLSTTFFIQIGIYLWDGSAAVTADVDDTISIQLSDGLVADTNTKIKESTGIIDSYLCFRNGSIPNGGNEVMITQRYRIPVMYGDTVRLNITEPLQEGATKYTIGYRIYDENAALLVQADNSATRTADTVVSVSKKNADYMVFDICERDDSDNLYTLRNTTITCSNFKYQITRATGGSKERLDKLDEEVESLTSENIVVLNAPKEMITKFRAIGLYEGVKPLTLLHFSDIHYADKNFPRILEFKNYYASYIDDIINTGDTTADTSAQSLDWYHNTQGSENILIVVGNHDTATKSGSTYSWIAYGRVETYARYLKPFVDANASSIVINQDAETNGDNYYYKDYATNQIRLIVLDVMYYDTAQDTWLQNALAGALTLGYSVVIAAHFVASVITSFECQYSSKHEAPANYTYYGQYANTLGNAHIAVNTFMQNGGKFICWMCGHVHYDIFGTCNSYPNQIVITVDTASNNQAQTKETPRVIGEKSQDAFNIVSFDINKKLIKIFRVGCDYDVELRHKGSITINYETKEVVWEN